MHRSDVLLDHAIRALEALTGFFDGELFREGL